MQLTGFHHLTAVTADAPRNHDFYTRTLGLRLVKKTVNQDDVSAYHLFYADGLASPGTDITFFDWPVGRERRGTHSIVRTGLRVGSEAALQWWAKRLKELGVTHEPIVTRDGRPTLDFEDFEGQRLGLVVDATPGEAHPWNKSPVPAEHQIRGLGPITISVPDVKATNVVLTKVMNMRHVREYALRARPEDRRAGGSEDRKTRGPEDRRAGEPEGRNGEGTDGQKAGDEKGRTGSVVVQVYQMGADGAAAELHVAVEPGLPPARAGAGGVHHVAFRTPTFAEYDQWAARLVKLGMPSSGPVDRYYFRSLYFREPNGILFEIATDGPGFAADESMDALGERLALPPFLESRRAAIEAGLKPLVTG